MFDLPVRRYVRPTSLEGALEALRAENGAKVIAGGTDLVVQLRDGRRKADVLVDLGGCDLAGIRSTGEGLRIGPATTMSAIAESPEVRSASPALAEAASKVGAWTIQCRATLGGNLANASPAADTAPPLIVGRAVLRLARLDGTGSGPLFRSVPVEEFFGGPGRSTLAEGEIIESVLLPRRETPKGSRVVSRFVKVGPRTEQIISVVSLAADAAVMRNGSIRSIRLALGSVGPVPVRGCKAEAVLVGRVPNPGMRRKALLALMGDIAPIDDVRAPARYRRIAAAVLLDRFLVELLDG